MHKQRNARLISCIVTYIELHSERCGTLALLAPCVAASRLAASCLAGATPAKAGSSDKCTVSEALSARAYGSSMDRSHVPRTLTLAASSLAIA